MKIAFLSEFFPLSKNPVISGGVESRTYYLSKNIHKKHTVYVITSNTGRTNIKNIYAVGPRRVYIQSGHIINRFLFFLASIIKVFELHPDIIDANNGVVYLAAYISGMLVKARVIYWVPDVVGVRAWVAQQGFIGGVIAAIQELLIVVFKPDIYIALSNTTREKLIKYGADPLKIKVVYPGV